MKIGDLFIKLGLKKEEFDRGLTDAKTQTNVFGNSIKKIGGLIAGAFAADKIIQFGKEVFNVATQAEGIQAAFSKIANGQDLNILRESVKGTVSDLELMKRAVMASNFGIPVRELGRLFEFASKRAQDTGQSVDYLVDSIVVGIGRKSPLILDNLGISAVQLKEKLKGVGVETASVADITRAVGDIAEESFAKTGKLAETLGTKVQTLSASWENLKLTLSSLFSNSQMIKDDLDDWSKLIRIWQSKEVTGWAKFWASVSQVSMDATFKKMINDESVASWINQKDEESSGAPWEKPKQDPVVKTAKERLDEIKKLNEEMEAARILRKEFYGEKMTPMTPLYSGAGDFMLQQPGVNLEGTFGNLDSHYKMVAEKRKQFTEEEEAAWENFMTSLNDTINAGITDAISTLASGFGEMLGTGNWDWKDFGKNILSTIGKFMQTLGALVIAMGVEMMKVDLSIKTGQWWGVIAAGAALMIAGSAVSAFAGKGLKGGATASVSSANSSAYRPANSNAQMALTGNVVFELEGTKLIGAINNTNKRNNLIR